MPRLNVTNVTSSGTLQSVDTFSSTDGFRLPSYSTAQRPTGIPDGTMIWNTTASAIEIYGSSQWTELGSGGSSAAIDTWADAAARPTTVYQLDNLDLIRILNNLKFIMLMMLVRQNGYS